jgi:tetratricopeptide (TPR) repeat protein
MLGDYSHALQDFRNIKDRYLGNEMYNNIGLCYYKLNLFSQSLEAFSTAIELTSADSDKNITKAITYYNIGILYARDGQYIISRRMFENCLSEDENIESAREALRQLEHVEQRLI